MARFLHYCYLYACATPTLCLSGLSHHERMCALKARTCTPLAALLLCAACVANAQSLTGITVFDADATGTFQNNLRYDTNPGENNYKVWIVDASAPGVFLNGPTKVGAGINLPLAGGSHTFDIYLEPGSDKPFFGMNLFFGGNTTVPGISVFAPEQTTSTVPSFSTDSSAKTLLLTNAMGAGSGSLSVQDVSVNHVLVTLTSFALATPSLNGVDRVSGLTASPSGQNDLVGTFTLSVASVPEPGSL